MNSVFHRQKSGFSQTYFLSRFVRHAQRSAKVLFRLRKKRLDSLWGPQPVSGLLSRICNSSLPSAFGSVARVRPPGLPSRRSVSGPCVLHRGGLGPRREQPVPDPQRTHSAAAGSRRLPPPRHAEDFLAPFRTPALGQPASRPRQTSGGTLPAPGRALQRDGGCRYDDAAHLRNSGRSGTRLCSQSASHPILLRSDSLQRGTHRTQPGHATEGWECPCLGGKRGVPAAHPGQAAFVDRRFPHSAPTRWSFLRPQDHRAPGKSRARLHRGGADVPAFEAKDGGRPLSRVRSRLGGRRVYLHPVPLERGTSFCGGAPTRGVGDRRDPTAFVHLQEIYLPPSPGHQHRPDASRGLAFLLRPRLPGTFDSGVQRFLRHGQDSDAQLLGQRRLYGSDSLGLRLGVGFSVPLSASRIATLEYLHPPPRAVVASGGMGAARQSQLFGPAGEVSSARSLCENPASYGESGAAGLTEFAIVPICDLSQIKEF